eukprot:jgi/Mesvir1/10188/Mv05730-RA.1
MDEILSGLSKLKRIREENADDKALTGRGGHEEAVLNELKHDVRTVLMTESTLLDPESILSIWRLVTAADERLHRRGGRCFGEWWSAVSRPARLNCQQANGPRSWCASYLRRSARPRN